MYNSIKSTIQKSRYSPTNTMSDGSIAEDGGTGADFQMHNLETSSLNLRPIPTNDPNEPLNWSRWRKWYCMTAVSLSTLFCFTLLCIAVPSWSTMSRELGWSFDELNNSYAMALASTGVGCVFLIPLAIDYGRRPVYLGSIALLIAGAAWSAKMTHVWELYVTQILMGLGTSTSEILIELVISDMFFVHERATMNGVYLVFCYLGNNMSQVAGGYITLSQGWRWNYWYCLIFVAILWIIILLTFEETKFVPRLPNHDPQQQTKHNYQNQSLEASEDPAKQHPVTIQASPVYHSKRPWIDTSIRQRPIHQRYALWTKTPGAKKPLWRNWVGPFVILWKFPVVLFVSIEYGLTVAWTSIMSNSASQFLGKEPYNFSSAAIGNINISPFVGTVLGTIIGGMLCDWSVVKIAKWNNGVFEPEMRLYSAILPALAIVGSLFMFGYGFAREESWAVPVVAYGLASFGGTAMSDSILTYLMDCYRDIIGQSLIGVVFMQNVLPTALVFALQPWIRAAGIDHVFVVCGCISIAAFLAIFPMIYYGKTVRHGGSSAYKDFRVSYIRT